ncbi:MAG TPA: SDR family NAD(P)-dependent oxidoreductase [bacterium]|nr:SDR family NAD(P)-dependent oxidoreductase [bacterium]
MRLQDKVAIVTGASSGLGEAIAKMFLDQGAKLVFSDINDLPSDIKLNDRAVFFKADVSKKEEVQKLINFAVEKFGSLDIIVNNAGIGLTGDILSMDENIWHKVIDINLNGVFYGTQLASSYMKEHGIKGSIINTSSILGTVGFRGASAYCASKGGLNQLTKTSALELAPFGIRVNAVAPGFIKTKMTKNVEENEIANNFIKASTPLGYMGEPDDIAYAVVYLASNESKYVTGSILYVDGGWTAQ